MKRKTVIAIVAVLAVLIVLSASQLQAQGTLTLESLAERFQLLTSDQDQLKERLASCQVTRQIIPLGRIPPPMLQSSSSGLTE